MTKIAILYVTSYISYISGEVRIRLGLADITKSNPKTIHLDYPFILNLCYFSNNYINYINENLSKFNSKKIFKLSDEYISSLNIDPETLYCPYCRTKLFTMFDSNNKFKTYCTNINCTTSNFLENLHYKFNILLDNDLEFLGNNTNLTDNIISFLYNNTALINTQTNKTNINDIFIAIKSLIDNSNLHHVYNRFLELLYTKYKNMSLYTYFKLTKIPQEFDDEIENLKKIKLKDYINTNNGISYIFDVTMYSKEFFKYLDTVINENRIFLKNFHLYII